MAKDGFMEGFIISQSVGQPASSGKSISTLVSVGLILIIIVSLTYVGYTTVNPHVTTVTQQQLVTNTRNVYSTQTVTSIGMVTSVVTIMSVTTAGYRYGYDSQACSHYGCYNSSPSYYTKGNYYPSCQSTDSNNTVRCSGYLYQPAGGCVELAVPIDNAYWAETRIYQYYTLRNLPSSYMPSWNWVTVTGQLYQNYNFGPFGAGCSGNYIDVTSISP